MIGGRLKEIDCLGKRKVKIIGLNNHNYGELTLVECNFTRKTMKSGSLEAHDEAEVDGHRRKGRGTRIARVRNRGHLTRIANNRHMLSGSVLVS